MSNLEEIPSPFEPKKENRFFVEFGAPFNIPKWVVRQASRPSFRTANSGIVWENMVFCLYDPIRPSTAQAVTEGLRELRKQDSQTVEVGIKILDPVGDTIEHWKVVGEINGVDFGQLDWNSDKPLSIWVYFHVNHAVLNF